MENEKLPENNLEEASGGYRVYFGPEKDYVYLDPREFGLLKQAGYIKFPKGRHSKECYLDKEKILDMGILLSDLYGYKGEKASTSMIGKLVNKLKQKCNDEVKIEIK